MKQLIALVVFAFIAITVNAQNGPQFKFKTETHDFGTLKEGPTVKYDFEFTNTGKEPLIIYDATADCGCTKPSWPKQPILPGQSGKIQVEYNTQGRVSPFSKYIYIKSNAPGQGGKERYELKIKGTVVAAKEPEPAKG
ncbi:hypothetical protein CAP35_01040 [Chitinophagaceae bacterium IBVUCB1]|nr:hypothetical protein CAP35_01040 [Chitinophagaceae bacterium IBVUCB1]